MENLICCSKYKYILVVLIVVLLTFVSCEEDLEPTERECKARPCGCDYVCSFEDPKDCGNCEDETERSLAQVCIQSDDKCRNAENAEMLHCSVSGGTWTDCGPGCGPIKLGENLLEERLCVQICLPQCKCPQEAPYWYEGCLEDPRKGPVFLIQKRSEDDSLKVSFRTLLYNYQSLKEKLHCATVTWDFGDGETQVFEPTCGEYEGDIQELFQASHTYSERGDYSVKFTLEKGDLKVESEVDLTI
ncbi:PKD domain-containing protein [Nanoarchaeota archaeon]